MYISYNWLKTLVETNSSPQKVAEKLTSAGLALEKIAEKGADFVLEIDVTSNRGDCFSHRGAARELATVENLPLKSEEFDSSAPNAKTNDSLVVIEDNESCRRLVGRIIRGVKIAPSPEWLAEKLKAVDENSINNVADITNFVMHELGNPMHAFDLKKLSENRIVVRRARSGEKITTLDKVERKLDETMLVIADAEKPCAVAGIMGGLDSSITDETTDVFLEVAYFDRDAIRQTSRKLGLSTKASHRFERGVDIENLIRASNCAVSLICEIAGGTAEDFTDVYPQKIEPKKISAPNLKNDVKRLTGLNIEQSEITRILDSLGFAEISEGIFLVPSWRHDVSIKEDLVEEITRIYGYDKLEESLPPSFTSGEYQSGETAKKTLRRALAAEGFDEALSYSFITEQHDETYAFVPELIDENAPEKFVTLKDSVIEGAVRMRPTLLPELLAGLRRNLNFGSRNIKIFEIGKAFAMTESGKLPREKELLAFILSGSETFQSRAMNGRELDFYDAKAALETAFGALNLPTPRLAAAKITHLRDGQAAEIFLNDKKVGSIGRISDEIAQNYKFKQPVFAAEIDLETLLKSEKQPILYKSLPIYPSVERDVSYLAKRKNSFTEIETAARGASAEFLQNVEFVDVYEGKGLAADERSLTLRFVFRSPTETLREELVDQSLAKINSAIESATGAKPRF